MTSVTSWGGSSMAKTHKGNTARRAGGHTLPAMSKGCQLIRHGPPWRLPGGSALRLSLGMPVHSYKKVISAKEKKWTIWKCKGQDGRKFFCSPSVSPATLPPLVWRSESVIQRDGCISACQQLFSPNRPTPAVFSCSTRRHAALHNQNRHKRRPTSLSGNNVHPALLLAMWGRG